MVAENFTPSLSAWMSSYVYQLLSSPFVAVANLAKGVLLWEDTEQYHRRRNFCAENAALGTSCEERAAENNAGSMNCEETYCHVESIIHCKSLFALTSNPPMSPTPSTSSISL